MPLPPVTVEGLMEQVVAPSEDGTLQVKATSELKPPAGVTVRFVVMTPPLGMETTGLATVRVKSGGTELTVTGIWSVWVNSLLLALMVTEPVVAEVAAFTVSASVADEFELSVTRALPNEQVNPVVPVQEIATLPAKPCKDVSVMVSVVLPPVLTVSLLLPEASEKSGAVMVTLMATELVMLPLMPATVTVPVRCP